MEEVEKGVYGTPLITDYIFDEVVTVALVRTRNLKRVVELGEKLLGSTELMRLDELLFSLAWKLFKEEGGVKFSFTDCTTLAVARARGVVNIATFDIDFKGAPSITG